MRMVIVGGALMMALFVAVISAVNAECPKRASGIAETRYVNSEPAG
jgi:hypothetical protein